MDKWHMPSKLWDEITYPFPNFNAATVEVWEWICNFITHFIMNVIAYPCWDLNKTMLVKKAPGIHPVVAKYLESFSVGMVCVSLAWYQY